MRPDLRDATEKPAKNGEVGSPASTIAPIATADSPPAVAPDEGSSRPYALVERAGVLAVRAREWLQRPHAPLVLLGLVSLFSLGARVIWLANPSNALIFDEAYYVNAARVIIGIHPPAGANYATSPLGIDPNQEHPPLGKLFVVAGMRVFGDNPVGWRFFSLVFGSLAILLIFWLVREAGGGRWLALGAAALMAVDNLSLVHGRIATLDVFAVVFMLAAAVFYLRAWWVVAAVATGLGLTVKLYTGEILLVLLLFDVLLLGAPGARLRATATRFAKYAGVSLATYVVALAVFDGAMHTGTNPLRHTLDMVSYAGNLKSAGGPTGIASYPWEWLLNQTPINYFTVNTDVYAGGKLVVTHPVVAFQGLMNPFVIFLALPAFALAVRLAGHERDRAAALSVAWILATFVPFVIMAVFLQRTEYLYYMVVVLPGIYIAVARLFSRRFLPPAALVGYVCALGYGFWSLYPFRTFTGH